MSVIINAATFGGYAYASSPFGGYVTVNNIQSNGLETLAFNDAYGVTVAFNPAVADAVASMSDAASAITSFLGTAQEAITLSDTPQGQASFTPVVNEVLLTTELDGETISYYGGAPEAIALADYQSSTRPYVGASNIATFGGFAFGAVPYAGWLTTTYLPLDAVYNNIGFNDVFTATAGFSGSVGELVRGLRTVTSVQAEFKPAVIEPVTLTDAQTSRVDFSPSTEEILAVTSTEESQVAFVSSAAESVNLSAVFDGFRGQFGSLSDAMTFAESLAGKAGFNPTVVESMFMLEYPTAQTDFRSTVTEQVVLTAKDVGLAWLLVRDQQTANWVVINDSQI